MDSPTAPKPGWSFIGPLWPKPDRRTITSFGLSACSTSQPRPSFSSTPGRKFSIRMSASASSFFSTSRPSSCFRLRVIERLLRACTNHHSEVPSYSLRHLRSGSPPSGDSTLITSAPNSAQMREAKGPAIRVPSSTTFRPARGLLGIMRSPVSATWSARPGLSSVQYLRLNRRAKGCALPPPAWKAFPSRCLFPQNLFVVVCRPALGVFARLSYRRLKILHVSS